MSMMITLKSSDGKAFPIDVQVARQSATIKTMLDDLGMKDDEEEEAIPLPNVSAVILDKVIEWATHHKDDPPYIEDENAEKRTDDIPEWDQEFLKVDQPILFELILAANYLDIKPLLDVTCKTVANMIKGKTPEEIRKTFQLEDRSTPSGEATPTPAPATPVDQPTDATQVAQPTNATQVAQPNDATPVAQPTAAIEVKMES